MRYLYILKVGETFPNTKKRLNDFDFWIIRFLKKSKRKVKVIDILKNDKLPNIKTAKGFIVTGSHNMVTQELSWSLKLEKYIKKISKTNIPLLGICYGHQLIAKALGGKSNFNKCGVEIGVARIKTLHNYHKDPVLKGIPKKFHAYVTHYQSVEKLPPKAKILAKTRKENHQAIRFSSNIWGVQFHPEFDKYIMEEYIINQKKELENLGIYIKSLLSSLRKCDISSLVLKNFSELAYQK